MRTYIFIIGIVLLAVEALVTVFGKHKQHDPRKDAHKFQDLWKLLIYTVCAIILYGLSLSHFDFWSDDFGYFQNFLKHSQSFSNVSNILISYLTGGVPRLQVGWHITHQLLSLFFGTFVAGYFFIQVFVIILNSFLLDKVLKPVIGEKASFWVGIFLIVSPFYKESFYWVSANYGFFQVLFFLISYLLLKRSTETHNVRKVIFALTSAFSVVFATLFQEQAIFLIVMLPIIFLLFNWKQYQKKSSLVVSTLIVFILSLLILLFLFTIQFVLIKSSSPTSLLDTFKMYYPHPVQSTLKNIPLILRETFFGIKPRFEDTLFFVKEKYQLEPELRLKFIITLLMTFPFFILLGHILFSRSKTDTKNPLSGFKIIGLILWFLLSAAVVIPINVFSGRYIYFMLPPALALTIWTIVRLFPKTHIVILSIFAIVCVFDQSAYYYGSFFPLTNIQKKTHSKVLSYLKESPQVRAIVFQDFPTTLDNSVSGVWINYHATEWWLGWKAYPQKINIKDVGNNYYPSSDSSGKSGFRVTYGDYPLERLKTVYSPSELLLVRFTGSLYDTEPKLIFNQRKVIDSQLNENPVILTSENPIKDYDFNQNNFDLQNCFVDIIADTESQGKIASVWLLSENGEKIETIANSSGLDSVETIFSRVIVKNKGPYKIRLTYQDVPYNNNADFPYVVFNSIKVLGCGKSYKAKKFVRTNNPDPKFPMIRWTSPQMNYSVTLPYPNAPMWEKEYSIGVNDAQNSGDYYCFPDDMLSAKNYNLSLSRNAYLGMLKWNRRIYEDGDKLQVIFSREPSDGLTERGSLDVMKEKEFNSYEKDDLPIEMEITHEFDLNKNYFPVKVTFKSQTSETLKVRYMYSDVPVMDFKIDSNQGMGSFILSTKDQNQRFYSTRNFSFLDTAVTYRKQIPSNNNLGFVNYSKDPSFAGSFALISDDYLFRNIPNYIDSQTFDNMVNKIKDPNNRTYLLNKYQKDISNRKYFIAGGKELELLERNRISDIFSSVGFEFSKNELVLERKYDRNDKAHGQRGFWFELELLPYSQKTITYYKIIFSDWMTEKDLTKQALSTIEKINKEN